jgi:hypothetical protein
MRAILIALILVLTGPSGAGSADGDLPGVGTFSYRGTPVSTPRVLAALGH